EDRDGLNDRPEDAAVGIGVIEAVAHRREMAVLERARIHLIAERAGRLNRHRQHDARARRRATGARSPDRHGTGERRLSLVQRERRREEVLRLYADPFERTVEERTVAWAAHSK